MKKKLVYLFAVIAIAGSSLLASCSKSNQDLIDQYRSLGNEIVEAAQAGDMDKVTKLAADGKKIADELDKRELTEEEQQEVYQISVEILQGAAGGFGGF